MEVVGDPSARPEVQREVQAIVDRAFGKPLPLAGIERTAFYQKAREAFAVVATSERRHYGCFLLKKGVLPP
jgi:L-fucose mutarotase